MQNNSAFLQLGHSIACVVNLSPMGHVLDVQVQRLCRIVLVQHRMPGSCLDLAEARRYVSLNRWNVVIADQVFG